MKNRILILLSALALVVPAWTQSKPNLSGEWKMNPAKSDFGQVPGPEKMVRKIEHNDPNLKITTTQSGPQGEQTIETSYTTDGKESVNKYRAGEAKSTAKWVGEDLQIDTKREVQGMGITQKEIWSLSPDGKVMTVNNHINTPQGEFAIKIAFDKQ